MQTIYTITIVNFNILRFIVKRIVHKNTDFFLVEGKNQQPVVLKFYDLYV